MRLALIGCMVMNREIGHLISESDNVVRAWWLRQGLHDTPDVLRSELQRTVDEIERENEKLPRHLRFEAVALAYGLCSNGVIGLRSRSIPLIIPRCDDCVSLFLGSAERYRKLFREMPGAYWYNNGWIEQAFTPSKENYARRRAEYVERYGEDNADFLMECEGGWMDKYQCCGFITYRWADENIGYNVGEMTLKGGEVIDINVPEDGSREAYEMAAEIMGTDLSDYDLCLTADGSSYEYRQPDDVPGVATGGLKPPPASMEQAKAPRKKRGAKGQDR